MPKRTLREPIPGSLWRPVTGWEGLYEVSDHGQVRRVAPGMAATVGYILKLTVDRKSYRYANLWHRGKGCQRLVHRLVALAFIGPQPPEHECNHKDGNKANNHVSNLEWVTGGGNRNHAVQMGLTPLGERNGQAKLTREQAEEIRALRGKEDGRLLAKRFGVSKSAISLIWVGKTWH